MYNWSKMPNPPKINVVVAQIKNPEWPQPFYIFIWCCNKSTILKLLCTAFILV